MLHSITFHFVEDKDGNKLSRPSFSMRILKNYIITEEEVEKFNELVEQVKIGFPKFSPSAQEGHKKWIKEQEVMAEENRKECERIDKKYEKL